MYKEIRIPMCKETTTQEDMYVPTNTTTVDNDVTNTDVVKDNTKPMVYKIKIIDSNKRSWHNDVIVNINDVKHTIHTTALNSTDNFKIHGMISSYHTYVAYYNQLVLLTSNKPESIEYLSKVNNIDVLAAIEAVDVSIANLRATILQVEKDILTYILSKIQEEQITLMQHTIYNRLRLFFSTFKTRDTYKSKTHVSTL